MVLRIIDDLFFIWVHSFVIKIIRRMKQFSRSYIANLLVSLPMAISFGKEAYFLSKR